ncbi:Protein of unknown function [Pseudovibrio ascidiaceicola]|uniref:DUF2026 domain-containing protein n=1 Tax=Pseudovibrio ascidiaceicola TaxID=285279 RepID=A0A1I4CJ77_9HYPH|nr:DUF2026 family protein [Pseudovibrio ascidiaceicola]SFK80116.1 Protein of unknown function [Pseudovibrio ascidiaceicola]
MRKFILPLSEYNRIHNVAHGVLMGVPNARPDKACLFFAAFGGFILNQKYKISTRVVAGAFTVCLEDSNKVACFGKFENDQLISGLDAFHVWLQTETHIIDFTAPIYRESFADKFNSDTLPRKMMQRSLNEEAPSLDSLTSAGDFRFYPDSDLTDKLLDDFLGKQMNRDLLEIATTWYGSHRSKQSPTFKMQDSRGQVTKLTLANSGAQGSW